MRIHSHRCRLPLKNRYKKMKEGIHKPSDNKWQVALVGESDEYGAARRGKEAKNAWLEEEGGARTYTATTQRGRWVTDGRRIQNKKAKRGLHHQQTRLVRHKRFFKLKSKLRFLVTHTHTHARMCKSTKQFEYWSSRVVVRTTQRIAKIKRLR